MIRILGAGMIVIGCGGFGFSMSAANRREERQLQELCGALEYMVCELRYRQTPLPELCRGAAEISGGSVSRFFGLLGEKLEQQNAADVQICVFEVLEAMIVSGGLRTQLHEVGVTLGRFDLSGQLRGLEVAIKSSERALHHIRDGAEQRRRSYQTLGLCAGAALAILFL